MGERKMSEREINIELLADMEVKDYMKFISECSAKELAEIVNGLCHCALEVIQVRNGLADRGFEMRGKDLHLTPEYCNFVSTYVVETNLKAKLELAEFCQQALAEKCASNVKYRGDRNKRPRGKHFRNDC